jgi:uncharacterized membrane protein YphA (DoxX/SURF4 family)
MDPRLQRLFWIQRIGFGAIFVVSGTDKFFNLLTYWPMYVSESFARMLPVSAETFMGGVGVIEILMGVAMLFKPVRLGAELTSLWMVGVAANLASAGLYDLATRDIAIALGTFGLARLSTVVLRLPRGMARVHFRRHVVAPT